MLTKIMTATLAGVEGKPVVVEADIHRGLPSLTVVGLADTTIKEACGRVRPAILNSGYDFPAGRVTINLVPAGSPKEGSHFDLPIAIGIIALCTGGSGFIGADTAFLGEISLDGRINAIKGALPLVMCLRKSGVKNVIVPEDNAAEVSILPDVNIFPASCLAQAAEHALGNIAIEPYKEVYSFKKKKSAVDFSQVTGQETAKRAVTIGAAGNHGIMFMGSPGCGKTMIARRIPTILPSLTYEEKLEITGIYSVAGLLDNEEPIVSERPFRNPHHTISPAALVGGGVRPRPGEISLAHRGVLFLDELGEFDIKTIDAMRQPIEEGMVRIRRLSEEAVFPAQVMVVAAANPCKCGNLWDDRKICSCSRKQIDTYMKKLSGPFSDRIDIHVRMNPVSREDIEREEKGKLSCSSEEMRRRVMRAIETQRGRYENTSFTYNGGLDEDGIKKFCRLDRSSSRLMSDAYDKLGLTMRAYNKVLKVSRTIADLEGEEFVREEHVAEALTYRADTAAAG